MVMKIGFKNVLVRGMQRFEIVEMKEIMKEHDLPQEYMNDAPRIWRTSFDSVVVINPTGIRKVFDVGDSIDAEDKEFIINTAKVAGARLKEINDKIRKLQEHWAGQTEIIFL
jgi:hypothetical protein